MKASRIFLEFIKGEGWTYTIGIGLLIIIDLLFLWVPKLIGNAVDTLSHDKVGLTSYIWYFLGLAIVITLCKFLSRRKLLGSIRKMEFLFRRHLCDKALQISTTYYEQHGPGKVMALMTNDVTSLRVALGLGVMIVVDVIFFAVVGSIVLIREIDLTLATSIMTPMIIILSIVFFLGRIMRKKQREAQNTYSDMTEFVQELFQGMNVIRAFNKEDSCAYRFNQINKTNYERNMTVAQYDSILLPLTVTAPLICLAISIYICGPLVIGGTLTVGKFISINAYIMLIIGPLIGLGSLAAIMQKGLASLDRITEFMSLPVEPVEETYDRLPLGPIELRHTTFTYAGAKVPSLQNVSVTIEPGQWVGIVGKPGSGKSTLLKLLVRLQTPKPNELFVNGKDVVAINMSTLRNSIAYVPSTSYILSTTLADNISFGAENPNHISVEEAAKRADLYRDLGADLTNPIKQLKEEGKDLSGGQKQRINIARGFYKNAPYLLLDDCFSALDPITVTHIVDALRHTTNQTILCVSQRLEAVRKADAILVMDDGMIVERGTHNELMELNGLYTHLYNAQEEGTPNEG